MKINQWPGFQKTTLSLDTRSCRLPRRRQMPSPADTPGVQLAHCVSLQPLVTEARSSTQERKGPQLCACPQLAHNKDKDGAQLEQLVPVCLRWEQR